MPGESNLLHTPSRKFLPAGLPAGIMSQCWEKGWAACRETSEVVCIVPIRTLSVHKRMVSDQIIILHLQCLSYRLRSICIVSNMTFMVDAAA